MAPYLQEVTSKFGLFGILWFISHARSLESFNNQSTTFLNPNFSCIVKSKVARQGAAWSFVAIEHLDVEHRWVLLQMDLERVTKRGLQISLQISCNCSGKSHIQHFSPCNCAWWCCLALQSCLPQKTTNSIFWWVHCQHFCLLQTSHGAFSCEMPFHKSTSIKWANNIPFVWARASQSSSLPAASSTFVQQLTLAALVVGTWKWVFPADNNGDGRHVYVCNQRFCSSICTVLSVFQKCICDSFEDVVQNWCIEFLCLWEVTGLFKQGLQQCDWNMQSASCPS